jgi:ABC-type bacteriocin/lantibiotic exporter with double-glycine peptidase domain
MRVNSNMVVRDMLTSQVISSLLDVGAVIVYMFLLLSQSFMVTLCVLGVGLFQISLVVLTGSLTHHLNRRGLVAQGKAQGYMKEVLTGIATIKASGAEQRVQHRWSHLFREYLNISVRRDVLSAISILFLQ